MKVIILCSFLIINFIACNQDILIPDKPEQNSFAKLDGNDNLQMAFKTYKSQSGNNKVSLISVIHIANPDFYKAVKNKFVDHIVLYEDFYNSIDLDIIEKSKIKEIVEHNCFGEKTKELFMLSKQLRPSSMYVAQIAAQITNLSVQHDVLDYALAKKAIFADLPVSDKDRDKFNNRFTKDGIFAEAMALAGYPPNWPHPDNIQSNDELNKIAKEIIGLKDDKKTDTKERILNHLIDKLKNKKSMQEDLFLIDKATIIQEIIDKAVSNGKKHEKSCVCYNDKICARTLFSNMVKADERNKKLFERFDEVINEKESNKPIAIVYGSAHMPEIEDYVLSKGFILESEGWHKAIDNVHKN